MSKSLAAADLDILHRAAGEDPAIAIRAQSFREEDNSIEVCWTTGAKVRRFDWRSGTYYDEELVVSPNAVRTGRLENGAPFLNTHNSYALRNILGAVIPGSIEFRGGKAFCRVRLSEADDVASEIARIREGTARSVSVGYRLHRVEKTEAREGEVATWRVVDWEPFEISSVPIPADAGAQVRSAPFTNPADQTRHTAEGENMTTATAASQTPAENDQTRAAVEAERTRSSTITTLAARHALADFGAEHVRAGTTIEAFRTALLDKLAAEQPIERNHVIGPANAERRAAAISAALLHRTAPTRHELPDEASAFVGRSLLELARDALEAHGVRTIGLRRHEIAERALAGATRSGGMMSTSDFPMILANVANKTLRAAYEQSPQTFRPLVQVTSAADFKPISRTQLGEAPSFLRVNESGEFKRGSMGEAREQYALLTYGRVVAVTRQVIINDDMDALTRLPRAFGQQAANLESDLVWSQIISNPVMGDGTALFHANHGNLAGSGGGLSVDTLGAAREAMRLQKGLDGTTLLNITPTHVIAPVAAETKLAQLLTSITPAVSTNVVPDYIRTLTPIIEPRLDGGFRNPVTGETVEGSRFAWYLASAGVTDTIELAYLEGQQGVYMESRTGFDVDGMELKVRLDVGAKVIDWRPFYKNPASAL